MVRTPLNKLPVCLVRVSVLRVLSARVGRHEKSKCCADAPAFLYAYPNGRTTRTPGALTSPVLSTDQPSREKDLHPVPGALKKTS